MTERSISNQESEFDRFCGRCAASLKPLEGTHLSADCGVCGRKRYFVRLGEGGKGIKVKAGEALTVKIPPISLKPGPNKLFKPGMSWLVRMIFFPPELRRRGIGFEALAQALEDRFQAELTRSEIFQGMGFSIDTMNESDWERFFETIKDDESKPELWAFHGLLHLGRLRDELANGNADEALVSMHAATRCAAILQTYGDIEDTLWRGYQWNLQMYEVAGVGSDPIKVAALEELATRLETQSDVALLHLANGTGPEGDQNPNGPLNVEEVRNVARFVLEGRQRRDDRQIQEQKLAFDRLNMKVVAIIALLAAAVSSGVALLGKWLLGGG